MDRQCRLYLIVTLAPGMDVVDAFAEALSGGDVACVLLSPGADGASDRTLAARLMETARDKGVAVLIDGDLEAAATLGADGIHIGADPEAYAEARRRLGADAIIGAHCGSSRHDAMVLAEMGANYVAFASDHDGSGHVAWWAELFEVPCVAWNVADSGAAPDLALKGADFIAIAMSLGATAAETPAEAVARWNEALNAVRDAA